MNEHCEACACVARLPPCSASLRRHGACHCACTGHVRMRTAFTEVHTEVARLVVLQVVFGLYLLFSVLGSEDEDAEGAEKTSLV